ncbi:MAG: Jag N-terminal domain-containing protein [Ruminococcus sp.]|nr:Jag N-terminal domain-containing protein [Ruminococcus sp.]
MTEIFSAKTIEEAKALAVKKFGRAAGEIKFEVLDEGKKGFLGIGKTDAKVRATVDAPAAVNAAAPAAARSAETVKDKAEAVKDKIEDKAEAVKDKIEEKLEPVKDKIEDKAEAVKDKIEEKLEPVKDKIEEKLEPVKDKIEDKAEAVKDKIEDKAEAVRDKIEDRKKPAESAEDRHDDEEDYSLDNFTLIEDPESYDPKVKIAVDYITSILNAMDITAKFTVYQNESGAVINIDSDNNGTIIGRRGETLDSIQYLCSIIANKGDKSYFRITIDSQDYRSKRKDTLEQLAAKVAKSVLRTGRSQPLEPMNPYERRVIHSAISKIDGVSSRSVGEEPYRKIIISSNNPKNNRRKGGKFDKNDRRGGNNRRRNSSGREVTYERKDIDLSTSFEKDYKKPKPEDSMGGGLYGKIEL